VRRVKGPAGKALTVERGATAARWTFIVDKEGKVLYRNQAVKPDGHAREVLRFLQKYNRR
jgi:peroxiredoxin Q/BCP